MISKEETMTKTLADISEAMKDIDFCTLATVTDGGAIGARPMSNNREVDYDGDSWFFTYADTRMVSDIEANPQVGVTYAGSAGHQGWASATAPSSSAIPVAVTTSSGDGTQAGMILRNGPAVVR